MPFVKFIWISFNRDKKKRSRVKKSGKRTRLTKNAPN